MLLCLTILCMNSGKDGLPGSVIWLSVIRGIIPIEITPMVFGSSRLSPLFSSKKNFNREKLMKNLSYPLSIFGRIDTDTTMKLFKNLVKRLLDSLGHQDYFSPSDRWLRMCLNWRKMRSLYGNSTDIQLVPLKRPLVWMYFYPGSSFLSVFTQRSKYSGFLNCSFWRGLNHIFWENTRFD